MGKPWELVVAFDRDSPEFSLGVEVGILYERLRCEPLPVIATVHAANAEMVMRLAEAFGASASADELDSDWLVVTCS